MSFLEIRHVDKSFRSGHRTHKVLSDVNLTVSEGEFVAIVGYSGSGKSTLMSLLAGLATPDSGEVLFRGDSIGGPGPERGIVFQNYSLLPWLTVYGNIALAVHQTMRSSSPQQRDQRIRHYIELVKLTPAVHKRPHELSGGMRQRVSLARTLAMTPEVLLLDEPLGALDALTRGSLQQELARIWNEESTTCIMITNDIDEAIVLADRIVPLTRGPNATLGPSFHADLPRPRDRKELNHKPAFKHLRNSITTWLIDSRSQGHQQSTSVSSTIIAPDLLPADLSQRRRQPALAEAE